MASHWSSMTVGDAYADRLQALLDHDPVSLLPPIEGGWARTFGRFEPDASPWAVMAFEPSIAGGAPGRLQAYLVEVFDPSIGVGEAHTHPAGDVVATPISSDATLSGLGAVAATHPSVTLLRYRPHRRCTLRVTDHTGDWVVKVLADGRGEQFHHDALELWGARQRGELGFEVAAPHRYDDSTRSFWQGIVPGRPIADILLGEQGLELGRALGAALSTLARSGAAPRVTCTSDDQLRRTRQAVDDAIRRLPQLSDDLGDVVERITARHAALPPDRLVPVHGAPHMHQWLITDDGQLGLIDFDRFANGEVELDIATLIAELHYEGRLVSSVDAMEAAVVDGFESSGVQIDRSKLQLYSAHKRLTKVTRVAWALRADRERRARHHLERIVADLDW